MNNKIANYLKFNIRNLNYEIFIMISKSPYTIETMPNISW